MTTWAVTWTACIRTGDVAIVEADSPEEALELVHRQVTASHADALHELEIDRPVEMGL